MLTIVHKHNVVFIVYFYIWLPSISVDTIYLAANLTCLAETLYLDFPFLSVKGAICNNFTAEMRKAMHLAKIKRVVVYNFQKINKLVIVTIELLYSTWQHK